MPGELRNLDLNLLITLNALLQERNVTRAAAAIGVTQPAVSAALGRLRRHFGDQLLVRERNRFELTPLAEQLATRTPHVVLEVQRLFEAAPTFDPQASEREFDVIMSDYAMVVLGDHLATVVAAEAPDVRLHLREQSAYDVNHAMEVLRTVDGMVVPHGFLNDVPNDNLFHDSWVCIVSEDNALVGDTLTLPDLTALPWVTSYNAPTAFTPAVRQLRMIGIEPRIEVVVDNFTAVPFLVSGTNRVALLQQQLASRLALPAGVRILPCPWEVVPVAEAFWWHPVWRTDPAHSWLRSMLRKAGRAAASSQVATSTVSDADGTRLL